MSNDSSGAPFSVRRTRPHTGGWCPPPPPGISSQRFPPRRRQSPPLPAVLRATLLSTLTVCVGLVPSPRGDAEAPAGRVSGQPQWVLLLVTKTPTQGGGHGTVWTPRSVALLRAREPRPGLTAGLSAHCPLAAGKVQITTFCKQILQPLPNCSL